MGVVEVPLSLWFRFLTFFSFIVKKIYDSYIIPHPFRRAPPPPRSCFSGKSLEPLTIPHSSLSFPPIHPLYFSQCFALDYVSFTLFSSSHHP